MFSRTRSTFLSIAITGVLFAGPLAVFVPIARAADRDWSQNPAVAEVDVPRGVLVYAIGDTHADYGRLVDLLVKGDIINEVSRQPDQAGSVTWKAGNAVLVCTGDMIDKSVNSVEVLQLFMRLRNIAPDSGGKVIVTCGNHEAEFLANPTDSNKKAVEFLAELKRMQAAGVQNISAAEVGNGTDSLGLGQFLRSLPFAVRVNDWFFAHAGNTNSKNPNKATQPRSLPDLQNFLQSDVTANGYGADALSKDNSILEAKLDNPWWEENGDTGTASADRLRKYVTALGTSSHPINHLVIGHQPGKVKFNGDQPRDRGIMVNRYLGAIFLIDCGMSSGVGYSTGALLRIRPDDTYSIRFEGNVRKEEILMGRMSRGD
jgi:hypothetical protein